MDIAQVAQTLVGTIVGGFIVIATNWISSQRESRRATQEWYEQTYLTDGIDLVIAHLISIRFKIHDHAYPDLNVQVDSADTVPVNALARYQSLLKDAMLPTLIAYLHIRIDENCPPTDNARDRAAVAQSFVSRGVATELSKIVITTNDLLFELREELLNIKIHTKHDIHNIHKNERVSLLLKRLDKMANEIGKSTGTADE